MPPVQPLPAPAAYRHVLAFDYDDTLSLREEFPPVQEHFFDRIASLRDTHHAAWGICTGRSLMQLMDGFNEAAFPFLPDFVVAREREIFLPGQFGRWIADEKWNKKCHKAHEKVFKKSKKALEVIKTYVEQKTRGRWVSVEGDAAGIVTETSEEMDGVLDMIAGTKRPKELTYERNRIYLRFSHRDYSKGSCLQHLRDRWGLAPHQTVAVGDNFNDLSMLNPEVSAHCGCPSNALDPVKEWVTDQGGHVSTAPGSHGVVDILDRWTA